MIFELVALAAFGGLLSMGRKSALNSGVAAWPFHDADVRIPLAASFRAVQISDGTLVAGVYPETRAAMTLALDAQGWTVEQALGVAVFTVQRGGSGVPALGAMRAAALATNVYVDADLAMKLGGSSVVPRNAAFVGLSLGSVIPETPNPDNADDVALTPRLAVESLEPTFPGARYVLFARQGETF